MADDLTDLVAGMNRVAGDSLITEESLRRTITERDRQLDNPYSKDTQVTFIRGHRNYRGDKLIRVASPHKFLDPANGPLIAVRLNILSRKTLGGLHTDLDARVLQPSGEPLPGCVRRGRGGRLRRRRRARLQRARGHLPRWLHLLGPYGGPGRGRCSGVRPRGRPTCECDGGARGRLRPVVTFACRRALVSQESSPSGVRRPGVTRGGFPGRPGKPALTRRPEHANVTRGA